MTNKPGLNVLSCLQYPASSLSRAINSPLLTPFGGYYLLALYMWLLQDLSTCEKKVVVCGDAKYRIFLSVSHEEATHIVCPCRVFY